MLHAVIDEISREIAVHGLMLFHKGHRLPNVADFFQQQPLHRHKTNKIHILSQ
jgi:hypothetical protein